jgi:hypothetical protein
LFATVGWHAQRLCDGRGMLRELSSLAIDPTQFPNRHHAPVQTAALPRPPIARPSKTQGRATQDIQSSMHPGRANPTVRARQRHQTPKKRHPPLRLTGLFAAARWATRPQSRSTIWLPGISFVCNPASHPSPTKMSQHVSIRVFPCPSVVPLAIVVPRAATQRNSTTRKNSRCRLPTHRHKRSPARRTTRMTTRPSFA